MPQQEEFDHHDAQEVNNGRTEEQRRINYIMGLVNMSGVEIDDPIFEEMIDERQRQIGMTSNQICRLSSYTVCSDLVDKLKDESCSICLDPFKLNMDIRQLS